MTDNEKVKAQRDAYKKLAYAAVGDLPYLQPAYAAEKTATLRRMLAELDEQCSG